MAVLTAPQTSGKYSAEEGEGGEKLGKTQHDNS